MTGQITIDEWLGIIDPLDELIKSYAVPRGYTLQNMDEKIAYEFDSYHGGACTGLSFEFSHGRAMFSREIFSGCAAIRLGGEYAKGVYILTPKEYKERLRRVLDENKAQED